MTHTEIVWHYVRNEINLNLSVYELAYTKKSLLGFLIFVFLISNFSRLLTLK